MQQCTVSLWQLQQWNCVPFVLLARLDLKIQIFRVMTPFRLFQTVGDWYKYNKNKESKLLRNDITSHARILLCSSTSLYKILNPKIVIWLSNFKRRMMFFNPIVKTAVMYISILLAVLPNTNNTTELDAKNYITNEIIVWPDILVSLSWEQQMNSTPEF